MPFSALLAALLSVTAQDPASDLFVSIEPAAGDRIYLRPVLLEFQSGDDWATDYPAAATAAGESGQVWVRVSIDPADQVASCAVARSEAPARLNNAACAIVSKHGRFRHALALTGQPVAATAMLRLEFLAKRLPRIPTMPASYSIVSESLLWNRTNLTLASAPDWSSTLPAQGEGEAVISMNISYSSSGSAFPYCMVARSTGDADTGKALCKLLREEAKMTTTGPRVRGGYADVLQLLLRWKNGTMQVELPSLASGNDLKIGPSRIPWTFDGEVPTRGALAVHFGQDGVIKSCRVSRSTGQDRLDIAACAYWLKEVKFTPPLDIFGKRFDVNTEVPIRFAP